MIPQRAQSKWQHSGVCDYCHELSNDLEAVDRMGALIVVACRECRKRDTAYNTERAMDEAESREER